MSYLPSITLPTSVFNAPAVSILLPIGAGMAVGYAGRNTTPKTYTELKLPPLRPPPVVFGPVWTVLYGLMGYGAYRAWSAGMSSLDPLKVEDARRGATLYTVQLALNLIWTPLFFYAKRPIEAAVDIVALTGTVGYLTYTWNKVDPVASYCLIPYLGWLSFATYLNIGIGILNGWNLHVSQGAKGPKEN